MVTNEDLTILERYQRQLDNLREREAQLATENTAQSNRQLAMTRQRLQLVERGIQSETRRVEEQKILNKELTTFAKSYAKLSSSVKSQLQTQLSVNTQTSIYKALGEDIARSKVREASLTGEELENEIERGSFMAEINASLLAQAKSTAKVLDDAAGLTEFDKMRRDLKESTLVLSDEERKRLEDAINSTEQLFKKEERIKSLKESQKSLYDAAPESLKSSVDFAKKLGDTLKTAGAGALVFMLLATVITSAISSFTALDTAAKEFRTTTGLTNSQMEGIKSDANEIVGEFGKFGVEAKGVFDTVAALKSEFSDTTDFSKETVAALTLMNTNFGVAAEDAAKVQGIMEQVGGLSSETAASVGMQAINMAKAAGVAPAKVMKDIAENAEAASTFFKGDLSALTANAVQARRMGSSLKEQVDLAEKLLDFEGSIEDELVAATFVSGQFNLSKARALAFEGKTAEAAEETLKQIQRSGDFRKQDFFTQKQLAKASGMTVEQINKQLNVQDKLNSLTTEQKTAAEEAIKNGLDITDINADQLATETQKFAVQQEQQAQLEQLQNAFTGIATTIGSVLTPLLSALIPIMGAILFPVQLIAEGFKFLGENLQIAIPLAVGLGLAFAPAIIAAVTAAVGFIMSSFAMIPFGLGIPLGILAIAGLFSMISKAKATSIGDLNSPADGKTRISTKEGGLFELSPNDDLVAAPGAANALSNASNSDNTNSEKKGGLRSRIFGKGKEDGEGLPPTLNVDFTALSAPLNMMISEIRGLRADMASGKIAVYMDTAKVTSNIGRQVDAGTRNNYSLGQA